MDTQQVTCSLDTWNIQSADRECTVVEVSVIQTSHINLCSRQDPADRQVLGGELLVRASNLITVKYIESQRIPILLDVVNVFFFSSQSMSTHRRIRATRDDCNARLRKTVYDARYASGRDMITSE